MSTPPTYADILAEVQHPDAYKWQLAVWRWLHQHPEIAFCEFLTSQRLQEELKALSISYTTGWGKCELPNGTMSKGTGIIATLGSGKSPCVALRADFDALPVAEKAKTEFPSLHEGCSHACGHDGHVASLLGAARYLKVHEKELPGTVHLMFQPAEEVGTGADAMVAEGALTVPPPAEACFGLHVATPYRNSEILGRSGVLMATAIFFKIVIHGEGGHAALPHLAKDPVTVAALIVERINSFAARNLSVTDLEMGGVFTVTMLKGSAACNLIPSTAELGGTIRAFSDERMVFYFDSLKAIAEGTAQIFGTHADVVRLGHTVGVTRNDPALFSWCQKALAESPGVPRGGIQYAQPLPGTEDFSSFARCVPSCFFFLSASDDPENAAPHHSELFKMEPTALPYGSALLAFLTWHRLHTLQAQRAS